MSCCSSLPWRLTTWGALYASEQKSFLRPICWSDTSSMCTCPPLKCRASTADESSTTRSICTTTRNCARKVHCFDQLFIYLLSIFVDHDVCVSSKHFRIHIYNTDYVTWVTLESRHLNSGVDQSFPVRFLSPMICSSFILHIFPAHFLSSQDFPLNS
jgi:hypothetical protein